MKSDRLSLSGRDLTTIMHDIDLLHHSREGSRHFAHLSISVCIDACAPGKTLRYFIYVLWYVCLHLVVCARADVCSSNALSTAHLLNNLTCHEYFYVSTWDPMCFLLYTCIHAHSHTALSEVLAECTRLFPMDKHGWDALWSLGAESVFLSSCQGVLLWVGIFNPNVFFVQLLGVRDILSFHFLTIF